MVSIAPEDAGEHFAWLAGFLAADMPASSAATRELLGWNPTQPHMPASGAVTRELLGWNPTQPGLIEDLDQGHYFEQARAAAA